MKRYWVTIMTPTDFTVTYERIVENVPCYEVIAHSKDQAVAKVLYYLHNDLRDVDGLTIHNALVKVSL